LADPNYYLDGWYDANSGVRISTDKVFGLVVDSNEDLVVKFKPPRLIQVLADSDPDAIHKAIAEATHGDTLVVGTGTYNGDINFDGKEIVLVSVNPDAPAIVGDTVIDCGSSGRAFTFDSGEGPGTVVDGFTIINGSVSGEGGGAIYVAPGSNPTITNLVIKDCVVTNGDGGAIYVSSGSTPSIGGLSIDNCRVTNGDGGAVYAAAGNNLALVYSKITNCSATAGSGGAVYCGGGAIFMFEGCEFGQNTAGFRGGGVYHGVNSRSALKQCTFTGNQAASGGGMYYGENSISMLEGCALTGNRGSFSGGGIYYARGCVSAVRGCSLSDNTGAENGGGIFYDIDSSITVDGSEFRSNASNYGGAVYCNENCSGTIVETIMVHNDANSDGGALYVTDSNAFEVVDCNICYNTAHNGGGLYMIESPAAMITGCSIKYNRVRGVFTTYEYYVRDPNDANVPLDPESPLDQNDPNFNPNDPNVLGMALEQQTAVAQGGGIYSWMGPSLIADCDVSYNKAKSSGGGLYLAGDADMERVAYQELRNSLVTNNTAGRDGGGVSCNWYIELIISNCTIADNKVSGKPSYGGALYCSYRSNVEVINSVIWGNSGNDGSQIAVGSGDPTYPLYSTVRITYSDIQIYQYKPEDANAIDLLKPVDPSLLGPNTPDYFIYGSYDVNHTPAIGVYGYVGDDGVDRIIHFSGSTAYIHTVAIPEGADPDAHPENPYAPGDVAERTLTLERTFDLGQYFGHSSEFYVDPENDEVYIGADRTGILKYVFSSDAENPVDGGPAGNYVYDSQVAPAPPYLPLSWRLETLAYDADNDVWYGGGRVITTIGEVWKYDGAQGPNGKWELAFTYTPPPRTYGLFHHDGMAFAAGHLFLSTMYGDRFQQFTTDGVLVNEFIHEPLPDDLESMGWGALGHFWVGSIYTNNISEIGGGRLQIGITVIPDTPPIHVEDGCTLVGWHPSDPCDFLTWDVNAWDPNLHNIDEDPNFVAGYYLSQFASGQITESNCIDGGSDLAGVLGMDTYTTRTDGVNDVGIVDMGYHYREGATRYDLTVTVEGGHGTVDPNLGTYNEGDVVVVTAEPEAGYYVEAWYDVNGVLVSVLDTLEVVMDSNQAFIVKFKEVRVIGVSGGGDALVDAVEASRNGDTLVVEAGT
jgi:hypothetical protein